MLPHKNKSNSEPVKIWEDTQAPPAASDPKLTSKTARNKPETALKPVPTGPLPEQVNLNPKHLPDLPTYKPPLNLRSKPSKPAATGLTILQSFLQLFTPAMVATIVIATNSYAENARQTLTLRKHARYWKSVCSTDIWRYLGCLVYMGFAGETKLANYWSKSHKLGRFLSMKRFQQIHRYFTIRDEFSFPCRSDETFAYKLDPLATQIRQNCRANWSPSSHLTVDESMAAYRGRTYHKTKLKNKPISEGYKMWVLGDNGYVFDWLWHSQEEGPEDIPKRGLIVPRKRSDRTEPIRLAPTFAVPIKLAQNLRESQPQRVFCLYLDNLFLNVEVAQALLALNICVTGITRKNAKGIPQWLIQLKTNNDCLVWNSTFAQVVENTQCFLWQDNNAVLEITTAYTLKNDTIWIKRKRPSPTSTNARIVRPVFGNAVRKWLRILRAINAYNHYMNGVDRANQLRRSYTVHRKFERRNWRPQWYFMLDTCLVNGFLIWKNNRPDPGKNLHRRYREKLVNILLNWPYQDIAVATLNKRCLSPELPTANKKARKHIWELYGKRGYCVWCKAHSKEWVPQQLRPVLAEIRNSETPNKRIRQSQSPGGCHSCGVYLCRKGNCFEAFHK
jgi:Transposase IS4